MSIRELEERRQRIVAEARERLDLIKANTDESRAAELEAAHDKAMAEHDRVADQIERERKQAELEARAKEAEARARSERRPIPSDQGGEQGEDEGPSYRQVFFELVKGTPISHMSEEARAVLRRHSTAFSTRAQTAGTPAAGGYTVPTELLAQIDIAMKAHGPMYDGAVIQELVTSSGNPLKLPTIDDTAVAAVAHTEGSALTDDGGSDVTFGQKSLDAFAFDTEFVRYSWELGQDSIFAMELLLGQMLGERLARIANSQLTTGTGSSAPNGIVTASSLGVTAAGTAAITFDEIIDLEHSVDPAYRASPSCAYMLNDGTLKAVRKLKDGDGNYLWQAGNVQAGIPGTLNGRRYYVNQAMDSLAAAKKVILFGDLKKYWVRKVGAPVIGVLNERFWPDTGVAGLIRFDGELANSAAVKHLITAAA